MKKFFLCIVWLATSISILAQSEIKITTSLEYNDSFTMYPASTSKNDTIRIDWGDGTIKTYNIDPEASTFFKKVTGAVKGDTIRILSKLIELDINSASVTSLTILDQPLLKLLNASSNALTSDNILMDGAPYLKNVTLSKNQLTTLDMRPFTNLEFFTASENSSLSTVLFAEGSTSLKNITMNECDISHFYPINLPQLNSLSISKGSLMELEIADFYPALTSLDVSGNLIQTIDVSKCPQLFTLNVSNNQLTEINVSQNIELARLYCSDNKLTHLNLLHNTKINDLGCNNNDLNELHVSHLSKLQTLSCSGNNLQSLNLYNNFYLSRLYCTDNQLMFLDFAGNPNMDYIDCRNNPNMTPCSLNYMFSTLLARNRDAYYANLLIEGSNGETSDTDLVNSAEMKWKTDVEGDGTAVCDSVVLNIQPAQNGTYKLMQSSLYGKDYKEIGTKAMAGTPIKVMAEPAENFAFKSVTVDGKEFADSLFVVSKEATVAINFTSTLIPYITLTTTKGTPLTFALSTDEAETEITIDWGDGMEQVYSPGTQKAFIDGIATGEHVLIKGEVVAADFASYPGMGDAWDNQLKGIDVSHNSLIRELSTYMNPIQTLDISSCKELTYLDCAYSQLAELNVQNNSKLEQLICYGNKLTSLDVKNNKSLVNLNAKINTFTSIDLSQNSLLQEIDLQGNQLSTLDVTNLPALESLSLNNNLLTSLDVSQNKELKELGISGNAITELDLSQNQELIKLQCADNHLKRLDLSRQKLIYYINCEGNNFSACTLNDLYYSLPQYPTLDEPLKSFALWVKGNNEETANDAEHAESLIAKGKGWTINYEGDGSGCSQSYVTVLPVENGTVRLLDSHNREVVSGSKVEKNSMLTVEATPDEGYCVKNMKANGKDIVNAGFSITRYTEVAVNFELKTGIDSQENATFSIYGDKDVIWIDSPQEAILMVYTTNGSLVGKYSVSDKTSIPLPPGTYIVNVMQADGTMGARQALVVY